MEKLSWMYNKAEQGANNQSDITLLAAYLVIYYPSTFPPPIFLTTNIT